MFDGETRRQLEHIAPVGFAFTLRYLTLPEAFLGCAFAVAYGLFISGRSTLRPDEARKGYSVGKLSYALGVLLLLLFFHSSLAVVAGVWGILALGDGLSTLVGRRFGRARLPWNREKSWAGSAAFFLAGTAAAAVLIAWTDPIISWRAALALAAATSLVCALIESLPFGLNDNILICLSGGAFMYLLSRTRWDMLPHPERLPLALALNVACGLTALALRWVSWSGFAGGVVIGTLIYWSLDWKGFLLLVVFFVLGSATSRYRYHTKPAAQEAGGRRGARHAVANGLVPAVLALAALFFSEQERASRLWIGYVASVATAAADTVATELGQVFGKHPLLLPAFRPVPVGTVGAISMAGSALGVAAALLIVQLAYWVELVSWPQAAIALMAAAAGSLAESYLAAHVPVVALTNELMNFLNTAIGAGLALWLAGFFY
ncbi:MAG: DUF92 domain-containing protein [Acidobacteria bacterium]|nr:DUF92 domain-containing protein [Acidobacteriota bacterium]